MSHDYTILITTNREGIDGYMWLSSVEEIFSCHCFCFSDLADAFILFTNVMNATALLSCLFLPKDMSGILVDPQLLSVE